ncbi:LruC domain-containing protein [Mucilaginibacter sp. UR6-1]|uniref:LruC domain-containing protein n=1 Tax=Mucilaginibacter sp. UR6-1 TaxID=1435643 RepID=UPI001E5BEC17|nr:LruC domain-containing protein [Mucilaginibacter sp. UR6-1]MCC8410687.1 LruC domain-containing protein [Mucilaginibacter sp. UR6-1]
MKKLFTLLLAGGVAGMVSCKKDSFNESQDTHTSAGATAAAGFNYQTSKNVNVNITLRTNTDEPVAGAKVKLYETVGDSTEAIYTGITDNSGKLQASVNVASATTQLIVDPQYVGLQRNVTAKINGTATNVIIGGKAGFGGDVVAEKVNYSNRKVFALGARAATNTQFVYPAPYTSASDGIYNDNNYPLFLGVPKNLEAERDEVSAQMLKYINNSLPEYKNVAQHHPEYLQSSVVPTINVIKKTDVTITFVAEGASYQNTLAYYTYPTANPPKTANDIAKATFIFPNASAAGTGGALMAGHKVKLGNFEAGTSIGFIVLRNSWTSTQVQTDVEKFYSNDAFNSETNANLKKHTVVLRDDEHDNFIIGFEDINRTEADCDNDFNDIVFYARSSVADAIDDTNVPPVDQNNDTDGDGVPDDKDEYPTDPDRAYNDYYPTDTRFAQFAFEDNWPVRGDYDMNDLVINYRYKFVLNAQNKVVDLVTTFIPLAAGSSFKNGFGLQLPVSAAKVKSISGQSITSNYITLAGNGVEAGQTNAVIIPFDHQDAVLSYPDMSFFVNTELEKDKVAGKNINVTLNFTSPLDRAELSVTDFNPFLIANLKRGVEVHLPGYKPTDKADKSLFGTNDDDSKPGENRYYLSADNLPWAISYKYSTRYAIERKDIREVYNHFTEWASSGGTLYPDWYAHWKPGYANRSFLYTK